MKRVRFQRVKGLSNINSLFEFILESDTTNYNNNNKIFLTYFLLNDCNYIKNCSFDF